MTQVGYTHDIFVVDRSGSMNRIREGMQSGFQELLRSESQRCQRLTISLWDFDDVEIRRVFSFAPAAEVENFTLEPRGMTPLHDATGDAVEREGADLAALPEDQRPSEVQVTVITDGLENSSQRRTAAGVAQMLKHQQEVYGWKIRYLGANQDAVAEGGKIGLRSGSSLTYSPSNESVSAAFAATASSMSRGVVGYTDEERESVVNAGNSAGNSISSKNRSSQPRYVTHFTRQPTGDEQSSS